MKTIANIKPYASKLVITLNSGESFNINFGREKRGGFQNIICDDDFLLTELSAEDQKKIFEMMKKQYKIELGT